MAEQKQSPAPNQTVKTPKLKAPAGACDCHRHIREPQSEVRLRAYTTSRSPNQRSR